MTVLEPIIIRKATQKDAAELVITDNMSSAGLSYEFWLQAVRDGEAENPLVFARQRFADSNSIFGWSNAIIAENESGILGSVTAYEMPKPDDEVEDMKRAFPGFIPVFDLFALAEGDWFIDSLGVFPEARKSGIAERLLDAALENGKRKNYSAVSLVVEGNNEPAIRLYNKKGFYRSSWLPKTGREETGEWWLMKAEL